VRVVQGACVRERPSEAPPVEEAGCVEPGDVSGEVGEGGVDLGERANLVVETLGGEGLGVRGLKEAGSGAGREMRAAI
jgi:hypothetical protein